MLKVLYASSGMVGEEDESQLPARRLPLVFPGKSMRGQLIRNMRVSKTLRGKIEISRIDSGKISSHTVYLARNHDSSSGMISNWDTTIEQKKIDRQIYNFIPTKEILVNAPGFLASYENRELSFDITYKDILLRAFLQRIRENTPTYQYLMDRIKSIIGGDVGQVGEAFFLNTSFGELDFNLVAEGHRKLALLWLLLQNGSLAPGSVLFWDEPEANLNPKLMRALVEILLELQRQGVQIFLATHHYNILKSLDLRREPNDKVQYFSFYRDKKRDGVQVSVADEYLQIKHDPIAEADDELYNATIVRELRKQGQ